MKHLAEKSMEWVVDDDNVKGKLCFKLVIRNCQSFDLFVYKDRDKETNHGTKQSFALETMKELDDFLLFTIIQKQILVAIFPDHKNRDCITRKLLPRKI